MVYNKASVQGVVNKNNASELKFYGVTTDTARTTVDNTEKTIKVDLIPSGILGNQPGQAYPGDLGERNNRNIEKVSEKLTAEIERAKSAELHLTQTMYEQRIEMDEIHTDLMKDIDSLSTDLHHEISDVNKTLDAKIQAESAQLQQSMSTLENLLEANKQLTNERFETVDSDIEKMSTQIKEDIEPELSNLEQQISEGDKTLDAAINTVQKKLDDATTALENSDKVLTEDISKINSNIDSLQNTLSEQITTEIDDLKATVNEEITPKIDALDDKIDETKIQLQTMIDRLHPLEFVVAPTITGDPAIVSKNSNINRTVTWKFNKEIKTLELNDRVTDLEGSTDDATGQQEFTYSWNNIRYDSNTLKVKGITESGQNVSETVGITFTYNVYYGADTTYDNFRTNFTAKLSTTKSIGNVTVDVSDGKYFYFLSPKSYGDPTFSVNGFVGGVSKFAETTEKYGSEDINYNVYRSDQSGLGIVTFNIS